MGSYYVSIKVETLTSPGEAGSRFNLGFLVKTPSACKEQYHRHVMKARSYFHEVE